MRTYIIQRLLLMIPTLLLVSIITSGVVNAMPGDAITARLLESPSFRPADLAVTRHKLGLDQPLHERYGRWLWGVAHGDFGKSLWSETSVSSLVSRALPVTVELALLAFILSFSLALFIGVLSAIRQDSVLDYALRLTSIAGLSIPSFWIGILFVVLAARWFGYLSPLTYHALLRDPSANLRQLLPGVFIIAIGSSAVLARMTRSAMLEVLRQDYVRTAWAKGVRERTVIVRHALKNALIPVVTIGGAQVSALLSGSVIAESIFGLPGLGRLMLQSVNNRDYITIQAITLWVAAIVILVNLLVDLLYGFLDPRIRY